LNDHSSDADDAIPRVNNLIEISQTELSKNAIKVISDMADEASGRFDKLTKFFIAGLTAANAAGLSAALGAIHGDVNSGSPLVMSAVMFAAGLTVVLLNPLLTLARNWIEQHHLNRGVVKLINSGAHDEPRKMMDAMQVIGHLLPPRWYGPTRFICNALAVVLFAVGLWWPIIEILKRLFSS
jgi:hypothetical protein